MFWAMYLGSFQVHEPLFYKNQSDSLEWLYSAYQKYSTPGYVEKLERKLVERVSCKAPSIERRGTYLEEFFNSKKASVFKDRPAGSYERMRHFHMIASNVIDEFYQSRTVPRDLIHVSCTGYVSPSAAQEYVSRRQWSTTVTHSYHMGCYGAFPALRMARGFLKSHQNEVDIFHTELCTLHLDPVDPDLERMVIQSLFADGCVIYRAQEQRTESGVFEVLALQENIIPDSLESMSWIISDHGMRMVLSKEVPEKIKMHLRKLLIQFLEKNGVPLQPFFKEGLFAIHPGGPRIIDSVSELLEIRPEQSMHAKEILRTRGNMSSATLPMVWNQIANDSTVTSGTLICSMAFGPGLTVCLSLMRRL